MLYSNELYFLCDVFRKSHVAVTTATPEDPLSKMFDKDLEPVLKSLFPLDASIKEFFGNIQPNAMYRHTDDLKLSYIFFLLPEMQNEVMLFIGPYVHSSLSSAQMLEIGEKNGISPKSQKVFEDYYLSIPVIPANSHLFVMLEAFGERIWGSSSFSIIDTDKENQSPVSPINETSDVKDLDGTLINMNLMEKRYSYENELIEAVSLGQVHKTNMLMSNFSEMSFEKRVADPLRNMKNYCIIMNTLLRKAAERGGVHPIYLDRVSSSFAIKIEQIASTRQISELMAEMFRSYCRLVRKHAIKDYSPIVQKAIIFIDSDLSANLTLSSLAAVQNISPGYLSTVFKKETGKTVTEYIREKRIKYATHLLSTTHLQIQTIALHCGIMDVQYFSKTFKKYVGKTPKEYRDSIKQ